MAAMSFMLELQCIQITVFFIWISPFCARRWAHSNRHAKLLVPYRMPQTSRPLLYSGNVHRIPQSGGVGCILIGAGFSKGNTSGLFFTTSILQLLCDLRLTCIIPRCCMGGATIAKKDLTLAAPEGAGPQIPAIIGIHLVFSSETAPERIAPRRGLRSTKTEH